MMRGLKQTNKMNMTIEIPDDCDMRIASLVAELGGRIIKKTQIGPKGGQLIASHRRECGMTQNQLSTILNVPQSHISDYERNKRKVPANKRDILIDYLNLPTTFDK